MGTMAVIPGATGGIGRVVAQRLWQEGYSLLCLGQTPAKVLALQQWFAAHPRMGQTATVRAIDLRYAGQVVALHSVLEQQRQPVSLLVTCHGAPPQPIEAFHAQQVLQDVWDCDVAGTLALCQLVYPTMQAQQQGTIVLLSSIHAHATYPERLPYSIAKAGVVAMARALAVEWGHWGITVNSLSPWQVQNARTEGIAQHERALHGIDTLEYYRQKSPLRRLVQPEDIAEAVLLLARTPSITGQDLVLDCGVRASLWHRPFLEDTHGSL